MKGKKGITLIALVITIIVLLILAGVSLSLVLGEDGIIKRAINAKEISGAQETIEKIKLAISSAQIAGLGNVDEDALKKDLTEYFGADGYALEGNSQDGWTVTIAKDKVSYFITANGSAEETEYEEPIDNSGSLVLGLVDDLGTRATIYLYNNTDQITSGTITITLPDSTTKNITAIEDTTNISSAANYITYTVSKNGTYIFTATDGTNETEIKIKVKNIETFTKIDDMGLRYVNSENKAYNYNGVAVPKGYFVDTSTTVDTGLVVTDSIDSEGYSTGNEWVWVPVNSTVGNDDYYGTEKTATALAGASSVTYTKYSKLYSFRDKTREASGIFHPDGRSNGGLDRPSTTSSPQYREIAILTDTYDGETGKYNLINQRGTEMKFTSVASVATQYVNDYNNMIESVDKYGGFYIGRYEITENGEKPGASLNTTWYNFYNQCMTYGSDYTESGMIYGALWDATMQWLAKSDYSVGYTGNTTSGYGNYNSEAVTVNNGITTITVKAGGTSKKLKTGETSYTKSNNIYDLSGNCFDWTQEANYTGFRVLRGGSCFNDTDWTTYSSNRDDFNPSTYNIYRSSRPQFYIK